MRKLPQVSWVRTAWATVVSSRRRVRTARRPSTSTGQPEGGQDEAGEPGFAPAARGRGRPRRRRAGEQGRARGPRSGSEGLGPAMDGGRRSQGAGQAGEEICPGPRNASRKTTARPRRTATRNMNSAELEGQPREVEVPAEKGEVGVEDDPADDLAQGEEGACGEGGAGGDGEDQGRTDGRVRPSPFRRPESRRPDTRPVRGRPGPSGRCPPGDRVSPCHETNPATAGSKRRMDWTLSS